MAALREAGQAFAVATVVRTHGSTPQIAGARLILTAREDERPVGTLGGGCVEADAIDALRQVLAGAPPSVREYRLTEELAWNTGLVCGGTMEILAESGASATTCGQRDVLDEAARAASGGPPVAFLTHVSKRGPQTRWLGRAVVLAGGRLIGTLGALTLDDQVRDAALEQMRRGTPRLLVLDDSDVLIEPVTSRPRLVIAGGGHVAAAIAQQAILLDFDVTVLEDRPEFADSRRFGGALVIGGDVPESIASFEFTPMTYLVIATRGHKLDADCVLQAARTDVKYIGLLGSRRKTVLIEEMLREAGIPHSRLSAIHAPVGLDLGGRTPAEIALSVLAEISQLRHGGSGKPLREA